MNLMVLEILITHITNRGKACTASIIMLPINNMEVGHHHYTQIIWPKYDIIWNNLQATTYLKVSLVVLRIF